MKRIALAIAATSLAGLATPANAATVPAPDAAHSPTAPATSFAPENLTGTSELREQRRHKRRFGKRKNRIYDRRGRYIAPRRIHRDDRVWRGDDGRYYCRRDNGTTGLVIGAAGGALLGRSVDTRGDRTVGTLLGGALGAVIGREIDRGSARCR